MPVRLYEPMDPVTAFIATRLLKQFAKYHSFMKSIKTENPAELGYIRDIRPLIQKLYLHLNYNHDLVLPNEVDELLKMLEEINFKTMNLTYKNKMKIQPLIWCTIDIIECIWNLITKNIELRNEPQVRMKHERIKFKHFTNEITALEYITEQVKKKKLPILRPKSYYETEDFWIDALELLFRREKRIESNITSGSVSKKLLATRALKEQLIELFD